MAYTNIDDPSAYFQAKLWTGNGSTSTGITITNDGNSDLQPDLIWNKQRTTASHGLWDSSRGISRSLTSDNTNVEQYNAGKGITSFNTNGFTGVREGWVQFNRSAEPYVAWQWKANGGTTVSNTDGSITSTVQANQDAGFSIVGYTCPDPITNFTIGHGLGVTPDVIIVKTRDGSRNWGVYHKSLTAPAANRNLKLNLTNAEAAESSFWANTAPTSSVITIAQNASVNFQGHNYIAYCFAEKQGYSKFGKYVGNGNANGTFVYTGFKPAFVLVKNIDSAYDWRLLDSSRNTFNAADLLLMPNNTSAEFDGSTHGTNMGIDFVSNGFKLRTNYGGMNTSGHTFIYMAFAESPFTTSSGIPTTAR